MQISEVTEYNSVPHFPAVPACLTLPSAKTSLAAFRILRRLPHRWVALTHHFWYQRPVDAFVESCGETAVAIPQSIRTTSQRVGVEAHRESKRTGAANVVLHSETPQLKTARENLPMTTDNDPLAATKADLLKLEKELTRRLEEMDRSDSRPKMDSAVGRLTFMDEYQQHQMSEHGRRNIESQLGRVHAALARVADGTYGKCARCGLDIPPERLEFMPEAAHCVPCHSHM